MPSETEVMSSQGAADYLQFKEQTIRKLAREGKIPAFQVGASWRFRKSTLDAWAESQSRVPPQPSPSKVLVVDDEEMIRDLLRTTLEDEGFKVTTAENGAEALKSLENGTFDVVVLDLKMPVLDGPSTLKSIRQQWPELPVIIATAVPESDLMAKTLPYTPVTVLAKPLDMDRLLIAVKMIT